MLDLTNLVYQEVPELATARHYIQRVMHSFVEHMSGVDMSHAEDEAENVASTRVEQLFNELIERTLRQEPEDEGVVEAIGQAQDAFPHLLPRVFFQYRP